jgi:predicted small secreted protein
METVNNFSEICILFLHYQNDNVTIQNYNLLKKNNPTKNVYSTGFENHNLIDGSHIVYRNQLYSQNKDLNSICKKEYWSEADLLIYDFYIKVKTVEGLVSYTKAQI